jgi:hypothetical protein
MYTALLFVKRKIVKKYKLALLGRYLPEIF